MTATGSEFMYVTSPASGAPQRPEGTSGQESEPHLLQALGDATHQTTPHTVRPNGNESVLRVGHGPRSRLAQQLRCGARAQQLSF